MKFSKKDSTARKALMRKLLKEGPYMSNDDIKARFKKDTGYGVSDTTIARARERLPKNPRKQAPVTAPENKPSEPAQEADTSLAPRILGKVDGKHLLVVIGEEEVVGRILARLFSKE